MSEWEGRSATGGMQGRVEGLRSNVPAESGADVVFLVMDPRGTILRVSASATAETGFRPDELIGHSGYDFIYPDDVADLARAHATLLEHRAPVTCGPYRARRKGGWAWIESTLRPVLDPRTGEVREIYATARDITKRLEVQTKLKRRDRQLSAAQRLARVGSWEWDFDSDVVWWSDQLYEIFGRTRGEFRPSLEGYLQHVAPEDRARVEWTLTTAVGDHLPFRYECRIVRADGEPRFIEARGDVVIDPDAGRLVMYGIAQDITQRMEGERMLARMHEELEHRSRELERSNIELEQFAYDASHDIGEPLRVVARVAGELAHDYGDRLDERGRRLMTSIVDGTERTRMLIADLLEYSRVSYDTMNRESVDCQLEFEETVVLLSEAISEQGAAVSAGPLPSVRAHHTQLRQLFQNLMSNAIKFVADQPPRVRVSAEREHDGWCFAVQDNGIGIEPHQAERVFELFRRLPTREEHAGTGMGLSICKRIVERHGGRIWVEPADGGGSVFRFTIPDEVPGVAIAPES